MVLLAAALGCARTTGASQDEWTPAPTAGVVRLVVDNTAGTPVEVYALASGTTWRIGTVFPGLTSRFEVPQALLADGLAEFVAQPADGSPAMYTGRLQLAPGSIVNFSVTHSAALSSATVRHP